MPIFRKKPVEIEAHVFTGSSTSASAIRQWMETGQFRPREVHTRDIGAPLEIKTLEGVMSANPGDYIIKGVAGEFYPCKPDIFRATYEQVGD
ncbi:hypothetical protein OB962_18240 [Aeromonas piscicola]|uniref:Phage protein n=1 Tax=Aeromonas piscicola TaxID=600645 RepID=A0ABT7QG41_9GAMM|nr:hypothetical protein [Aeromonas piscicola]MDM5132914.1 hypothetical protein [Aeromonas piscicola]